MKHQIHLRLAWACLALLCLFHMASAASVTDLPSLSTATDSSDSSSTSGSATGSAASSSGSSASSGSSTNSAATSSLPSITSTTTSGAAGAVLTDAPTIAGVGIPTLVVPYTADAPYMQKSNMPEGTIFIAVGAILAFLGLCVIGWRALVAWSINRSVKRAAMASIMASDTKNPGGWASSPYKAGGGGGGGFYAQAATGAAGSSTSLDGHGTVKRNAPFRNPIPSNGSGLFFSPTAAVPTNTTANIPMTGLANRNSSLLPAGYYASPSSHLGGGASQTTLGGPYSDDPRKSQILSPGLAPPQQQGGNKRYSARTSSLSPGPVGMHPQGSASSLQVSTGHEDYHLPGSRAPSAYLEDLFEGHGNPSVPR